MEEDVGVKGTVTRLRRRLSIEKTDDEATMKALLHLLDKQEKHEKIPHQVLKIKVTMQEMHLSKYSSQVKRRRRRIN
ncbi:hypothetical protein MSG28_007672 [Choristoneura fumiferana]|uniref:Uncharacterized protein n=1 Tax=Choristoneura fumiferana TaxID=7141 RepID=A0ACC0JYE9_CHOFU|nr:hypothetical protein MSG28_007672 [Choristoneura fumiferana]